MIGVKPEHLACFRERRANAEVARGGWPNFETVSAGDRICQAHAGLITKQKEDQIDDH